MHTCHQYDDYCKSTQKGGPSGPVSLDQLHRQEGGGQGQDDGRQRGHGHVDVADGGTQQAGPVTDTRKERCDRRNDQQGRHDQLDTQPQVQADPFAGPPFRVIFSVLSEAD